MAWPPITNCAILYSLCIIAKVSVVYGQGQGPPYKRFEYKYSFKGPYIVLKDNSVPFWEVRGHAIASDDQVRLVPSLKGRKGQMFTKDSVGFDNWDVELSLRVSGNGRVGADGMAFWYTGERIEEGDAMGGPSKWTGLGIFFDSFDNDGKMNNPYVYVILNDGSKVFDHDADGINQQLGGCLRDFRNKPFPVKVKIEYYRNVLTVLMTNGLTAEEAPELCLRAENVYLPRNGRFGLSAATGGLADDHDVLSFVANSLHDQPLQRNQEISQIERQKLEQQFKQYNEVLEQQRQEYLKQHPEKAAQQQQQQQQGQFENPQDRALRQIFDGQQFIHLAVQQLNRRIDEIIGRQERTLSAVSALTSGQQYAAPVSGSPPAIAAAGSADTIRRYEVDSLLRTQQDLQNAVRDIKGFVADIQTKISGIQTGQGQPASFQQAGQVPLTEIRDTINNVKKDTMTILSRPAPVANCPTPSCLNTLWFGVFIIFQTVAYVGYNLFRSSSESKSKKFY